MRKELLICDYCKNQVNAIEEYDMPRGNNIENFPPRTRTDLCYTCASMFMDMFNKQQEVKHETRF